MADLLQNSPEFIKIMKFKPTSLSRLIVGASFFVLLLLFILTHEIKIPRTVLIPLQKEDITRLTDRRLVLTVAAADTAAVNQAEKLYLIGKGLRREVFKDSLAPDSAARFFRLEISLSERVKPKTAREEQTPALECDLPGESFWKKIIHSIF